MVPLEASDGLWFVAASLGLYVHLHVASSPVCVSNIPLPFFHKVLGSTLNTG